MKNVISFSSWLARFVRTDNPLGDLARDWAAAKPVREPKNRTDMLNHLMSMRACPAALATGRRAWAAYILITERANA